jgi:hypothetical protein
MADCVQPGRALALLALLVVSSGAVAQPKPTQGPTQAAPAQPIQPAQPVPSLPWAHPALPIAPPTAPPAAGPDKGASRGPTEVPPNVLRPAARNLIDCKQAPKNAVTQVPEPLSKWATIYCTLQGHILTTNERYYSAIPGTQGKLRGVLGAAALNNQDGNIGHGAYFTKVEYAPLDAKAASGLTAGVDPKVLERVKGKPLFRLDLTTDKGQVYHGVVVDPEHDPFWVIPIVNGKIGQAGFYAATVDFVNKTRMQ